MYTVHLQASYSGINASRTTQFRIATGGPYRVYLDCPASSTVGSNLVCVVTVQDEGEIGTITESISTIWVDTNNDNASGGEPQTSFSATTEPGDNKTESVTISVPSTHATGLFVVRVDTRYVNSAQPNSAASDSVTLEAAGAVPPGVPAGGAPTVSTKAPSKEVTIPAARPAGKLLDITTGIMEGYGVVQPESKLMVTFTIFNLGTEPIHEAVFSYSIIDKSGKVVVEGVRDSIALDTKLQLVKNIVLPKELGDGAYTLQGKVEYGGQTAESSDEFKISSKEVYLAPQAPLMLINYLMILILIAILIIAIIIVVRWRKGNGHVRHRIMAGVSGKKEEYAGAAKFNAVRMPEIKKEEYVDLTKSSALRVPEIKKEPVAKEYGEGESELLKKLKAAFEGLSLSGLFRSLRNPRKDNGLNSTYGLKVYSSDGHFIGNIREVYLEGHRIYGWLIKVNSEIAKTIGKKNILLKHECVKSVKEVMLVDGRVSKRLMPYLHEEEHEKIKQF
jgi:sporulation protein YlmC with PRC-barrel domain